MEKEGSKEYNILMIKLKTSEQSGMVKSVDERIEIFENAMHAANKINKKPFIILAPEYFFAEKATKTKKEVVLDMKSYMDKGIKEYPRGNFSNVWQDFTGNASSLESSEQVEDWLKKNANNNDVTYMLSSRALNEENVIKVDQLMENLKFNRPEGCYIIPGTIVRSSKLEEFKKIQKNENLLFKDFDPQIARDIRYKNILSRINPKEAQLASVQAPEIYRSGYYTNEDLKETLQNPETTFLMNCAQVFRDGSVTKLCKHEEYIEITGTYLMHPPKPDQKLHYIGMDPNSRFFVKGPKSQWNYRMEDSSHQIILEICKDHQDKVLENCPDYNKEEIRPDIHIILSASTDHNENSIDLIEGGVLLHCDSEYDKSDRFGVWKKEGESLKEVNGKLSEDYWDIWLDVEIPTRNRKK